jgi:hypothetical protein
MKIVLAVSFAILVMATPSFAAAKKNTAQVHAAAINTQTAVRHARLRIMMRTQQVVVLAVGS